MNSPRNRFGIIFRHEYKTALRSRPFIVISVILAVLLIFMAVISLVLVFSNDIGNILLPDESVYTCAISEGSDHDASLRLAEALPYIDLSARVTDDTSQYEALLKKYDAVLVIRSADDFDCYEKTSLYSRSIKYLFDDAMTNICRENALGELGVSVSDARCALSKNVSGNSVFTGENTFGRYILGSIFVMLLFLVITLYGQMVAARVAGEKGSRTMELLATSAAPRELLYGKVFGVGAAGLTQISVFALLTCITAAVVIRAGAPGSMGVISEIAASLKASDILWFFLYFILGFLEMALLYGGLGALTEQLDDLSGVGNLPIFFFSAGYVIAVISGSGKPNGFMRFASFFPLWSPTVMFSRMAAEDVPTYQIIVSLLILALFCLASAWAAEKLYISGMFRYGKAPTFSEIKKILRKTDKVK